MLKKLGQCLAAKQFVRLMSIHFSGFAWKKKGLKLGGRWMNLTWRKAIGDLGHFCTIVANMNKIGTYSFTLDPHSYSVCWNGGSFSTKNALFYKKWQPVRKMMVEHFLWQGIVGCNGSKDIKLIALHESMCSVCTISSWNWDELQVNVILSIDGINIRGSSNESNLKRGTVVET